MELYIDALLDDAYEYIDVAAEAKLKETQVHEIQEYSALSAATAILTHILENVELSDDEKTKIEHTCHQSLYRKKLIESSWIQRSCKSVTSKPEQGGFGPKNSTIVQPPHASDSSDKESQLPKKEDLLADPKPNLHLNLCGNKKIFTYLQQIILGNQIQKKYRKNWSEAKPKSVLLAGVPGNGKTLIFLALASFMSYKIIKVTSALLKDKFHGNSEKMVVHVFKTALEAGNCFIIFDEIDLLLRKRGGERMDSVDNGMFNCKSLVG